ncbi:MAG TPA: hypothetical protein PLA68_12350 [Panacibacter sp.]|nr:hypothetical protein [Panacibacter sp.]
MILTNVENSFSLWQSAPGVSHFSFDDRLKTISPLNRCGILIEMDCCCMQISTSVRRNRRCYQKQMPGTKK